MLRAVLVLMIAASTAVAAPKVGEEVGKLGPSGTMQEPAFLLTDEYRADYEAAKKCAKKAFDGDDVLKGKRAVYSKDPKQGVVVLLDEFARRYVLNYCQ